MTGNQTMDYYVWPQQLYLHSRTCTRSGLCRRPSRLVASPICYLLDRASVHEISALVTWFQYMSYISIHYEDLDLLYIFSHHGDSDLCILYVAMTTYVISCIMPIHGHCSLMYSGLLYVFAELYHCTMLIVWLVFHLGSFITPLLGWTYNVFRPSYDPFDLTH